MSDAAAPESPSRLQARLTLQLLQAGVPNIDVLRASSVEELHALADEHGVAVDGQNPSRGAGSALSLLLGTFPQPGTIHLPHTLGRPPVEVAPWQEDRWNALAGCDIEPLLASGAVALLSAHWLVARADSSEPLLLPRQRLPHH